MTHSILMVGCGNMGGALLSRWAAIDGVSFTVLDPAMPVVPDRVSQAEHTSALNDARFDLIVVAVKPQHIAVAMPPAARHLHDDGSVISIAAGASAETVSIACGGAPVIRLMPNMPARIGRGISGLFAQDSVSDAHRRLSTCLAEAVGRAIWVDDEDAIDRVTAAVGSGPGYVFEYARAYQAAIEAMGFPPEDARQMVLEAVIGSLQLASEGTDDFETLRNSITSEGGTTAAGLSALNGDGVLDERLKATLDAAYARAIELRR